MDNEHLTVIADAVPAPVVIKAKRKCLLNSAWWPFIAFVFFSIIYIIIFKIVHPVATDIINTTIAKIFNNYSIWFGVVFALLSMLMGYILHGLKAIFKAGKFYFINSFLLALIILPWLNLAHELLVNEKRYTDIGRGLITYVGKPLWYTSEIMLLLAVIWFIVSLIIFLKKK